MNTAFQFLAAMITVPAFSASGAAQGNLALFTADPGTAGQAIASTVEPPLATPGISNPQPAECLSETRPWGVAAIYGWAFGMDGTVGARGRQADVNLSVEDTIRDVLPDLKGAAMLHLEGGYGNVGVILDLMYLDIQPSRGITNVISRSTIAETVGMYRVVDTGRSAGSFSFDVLAGVRWYRFRNELQVTSLDFTVFDQTRQWADLIVGARGSFWLCEDLAIFGRADIGGFGIGNSSEQACNLLAGFEYRCCSCGSLIAGYRCLSIDKQSGSGNNAWLLDVTMHGPFIALALQY